MDLVLVLFVLCEAFWVRNFHSGPTRRIDNDDCFVFVFSENGECADVFIGQVGELRVLGQLFVLVLQLLGPELDSFLLNGEFFEFLVRLQGELLVSSCSLYFAPVFLLDQSYPF